MQLSILPHIIRLAFYPLIFLLMLGIQSCIKEEASLQDPQVRLNPGLGLPAVHAHYSLASVFKSTDTLEIIQPNDEGILTVRYSEQLFSEIASEFITFNQEIKSSVTIPLKNYKNYTKIVKRDTIEFDFSNTQAEGVENALLYELKFKYAEFWLSDNLGDTTGSPTVEISFPTIYDPETLDTASLLFNIGTSDISTLPLSGNVAKFITDSVEGKTMLLVDLIIEGLTKNTKDFRIDYSFELIDYDYIKGFFGEFEMDLGSTSVPLDLYSLVDSIQIVFKEPQFNINFNNSFGVALDLFMENLYAVSNNEDIIDIDFLPVDGNPFSLRPPPLGVVQDSLFEVPVNDVLHLLSQKPKKLVFNPVGRFNPGGLSDTNYISFDSQFALDVGIEIPLEFWGVIAFTEKLPFDGSSLDNITQLQYLGLLMASNNKLPLEAKVDVIFTKGNQVMYTVGGTDGFQIQSNLSGSDDFFRDTLSIETDQFDNLKQSDSLSLKILLKTTGADQALVGDTIYVPFNANFEEYFIDLSVKVIVEGEVILPPK